MSSVIKQFSLTDLSNLYRIAYGDFELDAAGWDHSELIGLIQKSSKFVGNRLEMAQLVDWGGGQSSGASPKFFHSLYQSTIHFREISLCNFSY